MHRTGGSGRGPGEFTAINHVEITDDHLYVLDLIQNRVTQYQIAGNTLELLTTIPIPESAVGGQYRSIHQINGKLWGGVGNTRV